MIVLLIMQIVMITITEHPVSQTEKKAETIQYEMIERFIEYDRAIQNQDFDAINFVDGDFIKEYESKYLSDLQPTIIKKLEHKIAVDQYDTYIDNILNFAKDNDQNMFSKYSRLKNIQIEAAPNSGGLAVIKSLIPSFSILLFAFLFPSFLMHTDIEYESFYETLSGGKRKLLQSKLLTTLFITLMFSFGLTITSLLVNYGIYGDLNLNMNIQSYMEFIQSPYNITIFQSIMIISLWNFLITFSLICILLVIWNKFTQATLVSAIVLGFLIILSIFISSKSIISFIHMINPVSQYYTFANLSQYKVYFNFISEMTLIVLIQLSIVILSVSCIFILKNRFQTKIPMSHNIGFYRHTNLFFHELEFALLNLKGIVFTILIVGIVGLQWKTNFQHSYTPAYIQNINNKSEIFENETFDSLQAKVEDDSVLESRINEMMQNDKLVQSDVDAYFNDLHELRIRKIVYNQMVEGYEVEPTGYIVKYQVNSEKTDFINMLLLSIFVIIFLGLYFSSHLKDAELDVYNGTVNSQKRNYSRYVVGSIYGLVIFCVIFGTQTVMLKRVFNFTTTSVNNFLWENSSFNPNLNTNIYDIQLFLSRILGLYLLTSLTYIITKITKSQWVSTAILMTILFLPLLITETFGINTSFVSLADLILGNRFLNTSTWLLKVPLIIVITSQLRYLLKE